MYDVAIIGGGPAGVSAAINLKILQKKFIWFSGNSGLKVERAELVKNYPALPDVTGRQLNWAFYNHAESMGINADRRQVTAIYDLGEKFSLTVENEQTEAKSVILCTGVQSVKPLSGEEEFLGRGVSYCATCDGFLYKDKTIAVLCTDKSFESEVEFLCRTAKKTYFFPMYKDYKTFSGAEVILKMPEKVEGDLRVKKVAYKGGDVAVDGFFILRSSMPPKALLHGLECEGERIVVDRLMRTNINGVFAAGDCTGRPYQYAKSVGEGNVAAHSAVEFLAGK